MKILLSNSKLCNGVLNFSIEWIDKADGLLAEKIMLVTRDKQATMTIDLTESTQFNGTFDVELAKMSEMTREKDNNIIDLFYFYNINNKWKKQRVNFGSIEELYVQDDQVVKIFGTIKNNASLFVDESVAPLILKNTALNINSEALLFSTEVTTEVDILEMGLFLSKDRLTKQLPLYYSANKKTLEGEIDLDTLSLGYFDLSVYFIHADSLDREVIPLDIELDNFSTTGFSRGKYVGVTNQGNQLKLAVRKKSKVFDRIATGLYRATVKSKENIVSIRNKSRSKKIQDIFRQKTEPFENPTIIFESFGGRQISDSPLALYDYIKNNYQKIDVIWSVEKSMVSYCKKNDINYVLRNTVKWAESLTKAQVWVSNARFPNYVRKQKHTFYVQTWHGTPLKKLGLDIDNVLMPGTTTKKYHKNFVAEANKWDVLVSPNQYSSSIFRRAFGFKNVLLNTGYPRTDKLVSSTNDQIMKMKMDMGIPLSKKVVLYAPTYRDDSYISKGKYAFELPFDVKKMQETLGDEYVLVLRMHYLISSDLNVAQYGDFVIDQSNYHDISDLYLVADLMITDYSSVFFDYAYLKKPVLFYPYDFEKYKDELRGFYLDYETELPGEIAYTEKELLNALSAYKEDSSAIVDDRMVAFYDEFCPFDKGDATKKIGDHIIGKIL